MELVRMTVLVVGGSTDVALGIEGHAGLVSCAVSDSGPAIEAAARNAKSPDSHAIVSCLLRNCRCHQAKRDSACNRATADLNLSGYIGNEIRASRAASADSQA